MKSVELVLHAMWCPANPAVREQPGTCECGGQPIAVRLRDEPRDGTPVRVTEENFGDLLIQSLDEALTIARALKAKEGGT